MLTLFANVTDRDDPVDVERDDILILVLVVILNCSFVSARRALTSTLLTTCHENRVGRLSQNEFGVYKRN